MCISIAGRCTGSPPRMRGKHIFDRRIASVPRITPAYAGKTVPLTPAVNVSRDHPRVCGENDGRGRLGVFTPGSPPRMRGKPLTDGSDEYARRITPAGAGKTGMQGVLTPCVQDHPRRCGENPCLASRISMRLGSPPQVRGKRGLDRRKDPSGRITPAGAGKTPKSKPR